MTKPKAPAEKQAARVPTPPPTTGPRLIVPTLDFEARGPIAAAGGPSPHLNDHGGPLLGSVEVVPIYWGAAWASGVNATMAAELDTYFDYIVSSSYLDSLAEYGRAGAPILHGRRLQSVRVSNSEPGTQTAAGRQVTDDQIRAALAGWLGNHTIPAKTANTLYFVMLPPGVTSVGLGTQSCVAGGYCGYHNADGGTYYAVIPYANCNGCAFPGQFLDTLTEVISHELAEAITDPALNAWWDPNTGPGDEIGDICNRQTVRLGGYLVQTEWSNALNACTIRMPGPSAYTFINTAAGLTEQHHLFKTADGHLHALWFNFASGWHTEDRSAMLPGVPPAVGEPFGYPFVNETTGLTEQHNLFRTADGHLHALWFNFAQGWHHEDRTAIVGGHPPAVGDPVCYPFVNEKTGLTEQHNLFRTADGHIHALWFNFGPGWHHEDRTTIVPGTPPAVGQPCVYTFVNETTGLTEQHNLFRTADGHIHALWFNFQTGWHHEDRTAMIAGTPPAAGDPVAYTFVNEKTGLTEQHNLFRTADGHVHALWFNFQTGWHHEDRTLIVPGTPPAVGQPFGYPFVNETTGLTEQHNLFRSADGHIHALWFNFQQGWHHEDRTAMVAGTPASVSDPSAYPFIDEKTGLTEQHNLFRTADGHIHALWFNFASGWHHEDRGGD